ncbi:MAG: hypothetical protein PVG03_15000 [Desulfarculaceae bacterium]
MRRMVLCLPMLIIWCLTAGLAGAGGTVTMQLFVVPDDSPVPYVLDQKQIRVDFLDQPGGVLFLTTNSQGEITLPGEHRSRPIRIKTEPKCSSEIYEVQDQEVIYLICSWSGSSG